uniref:Uncharacterized protein n=1 Tax=Fagus sylvatica TaxID=28930 RepID=A0A2N9HD83_FAGSY
MRRENRICTPRAAPSCAAHDGPARVVVLPRGSLILPRQQLLESSSISVRVPFFIRFSGAVLEVFRNSKWVMRHIVGKLSTSSFQRYKVCTNRSSDEGVMAPGSRGVGAVFVHSSGEDSGQTGDAIGEPRVPRRSRSHYLSNAPGLADQLVASRKDSAREGGSCAAYFCKVPDFAGIRAWTCEIWPREAEVHRGVFGPFEGSFPIRIPADPDKFLAIREFHVVHGCVLFPMCPGSQINLLRVRKTLCASVATSALHRGELGFARYDLANGGRRNVPYAKGYCEKSSSVCVSFSVRRAGSQPVDTRVKSLDLALRKSVRPSETWLGNPSKRSGTNWDLTLSRIAIGPGLGIPSKRSGTNWDLTLSRIAIGCLTEVVVAEIVAGPHALDSCECMNIEGRHFLNLRSVRLNLRLFQLIPDGGSTSLISGLSSNFSVRGKIAPVWYNKINEFLIPGLRYLSPIWEILQEVSIRLDDVDLQPWCKVDGALYEIRPLEGLENSSLAMRDPGSGAPWKWFALSDLLMAHWRRKPSVDLAFFMGTVCILGFLAWTMKGTSGSE